MGLYVDSDMEKKGSLQRPMLLYGLVHSLVCRHWIRKTFDVCFSLSKQGLQTDGNVWLRLLSSLFNVLRFSDVCEAEHWQRLWFKFTESHEPITENHDMHSGFCDVLLASLSKCFPTQSKPGTKSKWLLFAPVLYFTYFLNSLQVCNLNTF